MRLQILIEFLSGLLQAVSRSVEIGMQFEGENDEVSRLQRLNQDIQIPEAGADLHRSFPQMVVHGLQMVQHDALVSEMKPMGVSLQGSLALDALAIIVRESGRNSSVHSIQQFSESR